VAAIPAAPAAEPVPAMPSGPDIDGGRPSIAVLPFRLIGSTEAYGAIADAVPAELISSLSRLRWLRVVARGSTFRFRDATPDLDAIREKLGAGYCLSGDVEVFGSGLAISVELSDTREGRVVWGERLSGKVDDVHQMRSDIVNLVTSSMELHISLNEAERVRLRSPESLDAWSVYHVGLRHMYRFNRNDNTIAAQLLTRATELDPGFARAYAARSFTQFQIAFLRYETDTTAAIENARRFAEKCVELDPFDPFGNFTYGRSHWLRGDPEAGQAWLERAVSLSPSFAQGIYAPGWADMMAGRGREAVRQYDTAIGLSPLDPFL
jgi:TolB-like protein